MTRRRSASPVRRRIVEALELKPGDVVVDVGCGTGNSFELIQERIGPTGTLIGIELSPEMIAQARERVAANGWQNVTLIAASADQAQLPLEFDAVVFVYTQDVLQSRAALENIFSSAKPNARVAAGGTKLFPWWLAPANLYLLFRVRHYVTTFASLRAPWRVLQEFVPDLRVSSVLLGRSYIAHGTYRRRPKER